MTTGVEGFKAMIEGSGHDADEVLKAGGAKLPWPRSTSRPG
jgi:hypothetical protein